MASRASKKRKERAAREAARAETIFDQWTPESVHRLLTAASMTPSARHRLISIAHALSLSLKGDARRGGVAISAKELDGVLEQCRALEPGLATLEDYVPLDPTMSIRMRHRGEWFRIHPASLERPIAAIRRAQLVALSADGVLLEALGFGIADLLELVLRYVDGTLQIASTLWSPDRSESAESKLGVSDLDVALVASYPSLENVLAASSSPIASRAALEFFSVDRPNLRFSPGDGDSSFASTLAIRDSESRLWPLPPPFLMESAFAAVQDLCARAHGLDPNASRDFARRARSAVERAFRTLSLPIELSAKVSSGVQLALMGNGEEWFAVALAATLSIEEVEQQLQDAGRLLVDVQPGAIVGTADGSRKTIPRSAEVVRVLIAATPGHMFLGGPPGIARMTLDDLEWIALTADDPDDMLLFCRDLCDPPAIGRMLTLETINAWEIWRQNGKAFHRSGTPISLLAFAPHAGDAEWTKAAENNDVDAALQLLGIDPLLDWDASQVDERLLRVLRHDPPQAWLMLIRPSVPIGVRLFANEFSTQSSLLDALAGSLLWNIERLGDTLTSAMMDAGIASLRVHLKPSATQEASTKAALYLDGVTPPNIVQVSWDERLAESLESNPGSGEAMLGQLLLGGLKALGVTAGLLDIERAWQALPRSLSVDSVAVAQKRADLPAPTKPHPSFDSEALRRLGKSLHDVGLTNKSFANGEAIRLESQTIYPLMTHLLLDACARCSQTDVLIHAGSELERVAHQRSRQRKQLEWNTRAMPVAYDPIEHSMSIEAEAGRLSRAVQLTIETLLIKPASGSLEPSQLAWRRILSFAITAVASAIRGESVQYGLHKGEVRVSEQGEVSFHETGAPMVDMVALQRAQAEAHHAGQSGADETSLKTAIEKLDAVMLDVHGYRITSLLTVLSALQGWPTDQSAEVVGLASARELQEFVEKVTQLSSAEIQAAIAALTLRAVDLRSAKFEPWEFARRTVRLVTRPVVDLGNDKFMILPWFTAESLGIYTRYLSDARLPWPTSANPSAVSRVLDEERRRRNTLLEKDVESALVGCRLVVKIRIKKASIIGLTSLSGEIDAIAVDTSRRNVWVVEVKDPSEPFAPAEIERAVRRFHGTDGWIAALLKKVADVAKDPCAVARALGVTSDQQWQVRGIVVTRRPVHAAFVEGSPVPFTTLGQCAETFCEGSPSLIVEASTLTGQSNW